MPEQAVSPPSQASTHWPFWQASPPVHVPQLSPQPLSPQSFPTQEGVQMGGEVVGTQLPAWQVPPGHAAPSGSVPLHLPFLRFRHGGQAFFLRFFPSAWGASLGRWLRSRRR